MIKSYPTSCARMLEAAGLPSTLLNTNHILSSKTSISCSPATTKTGQKLSLLPRRPRDLTKKAAPNLTRHHVWYTGQGVMHQQMSGRSYTMITVLCFHPRSQAMLQDILCRCEHGSCTEEFQRLELEIQQDVQRRANVTPLHSGYDIIASSAMNPTVLPSLSQDEVSGQLHHIIAQDVDKQANQTVWSTPLSHLSNPTATVTFCGFLPLAALRQKTNLTRELFQLTWHASSWHLSSQNGTA